MFTLSNDVLVIAGLVVVAAGITETSLESGDTPVLLLAATL